MNKIDIVKKSQNYSIGNVGEFKYLKEYSLDGEVTDIKEGSVIRVAPQANRRWKNNSKDDLIMMVVQAVNGTLKNHNITDGYSKEQ